MRKHSAVRNPRLQAWGGSKSSLRTPRLQAWEVQIKHLCEQPFEMKESDIVSKIRLHFRQHAPHAIVIKRADQSTLGLPDMDITRVGQTTFLEIKLLRKKDENRSGFEKNFSALQIAQCCVLAREGICFYLVTDGRLAALMRPDTVRRILEIPDAFITIDGAQSYESKVCGKLEEVLRYLSHQVELGWRL